MNTCSVLGRRAPTGANQQLKSSGRQGTGHAAVDQSLMYRACAAGLASSWAQQGHTEGPSPVCSGRRRRSRGTRIASGQRACGPTDCRRSGGADSVAPQHGENRLINSDADGAVLEYCRGHPRGKGPGTALDFESSKCLSRIGLLKPLRSGRRLTSFSTPLAGRRQVFVALDQPITRTAKGGRAGSGLNRTCNWSKATWTRICVLRMTAQNHDSPNGRAEMLLDAHGSVWD